ncbi:hypothetical protein Q7P37_002042 [Cladosporium fusiforme]
MSDLPPYPNYIGNPSASSRPDPALRQWLDQELAALDDFEYEAHGPCTGSSSSTPTAHPATGGRNHRVTMPSPPRGSNNTRLPQRASRGQAIPGSVGTGAQQAPRLALPRLDPSIISPLSPSSDELRPELAYAQSQPAPSNGQSRSTSSGHMHNAAVQQSPPRLPLTPASSPIPRDTAQSSSERSTQPVPTAPRVTFAIPATRPDRGRDGPSSNVNHHGAPSQATGQGPPRRARRVRTGSVWPVPGERRNAFDDGAYPYLSTLPENIRFATARLREPPRMPVGTTTWDDHGGDTLVALADYAGPNDEYLSFRAGDRVTLIGTGGDGADWLYGELNGRHGWMPSQQCTNIHFRGDLRLHENPFGVEVRWLSQIKQPLWELE